LIGIEPADEEERLRAYGVDRIRDLAVKKKKFKHNPDIDPDEHYRDVLGIWSGKDYASGEEIPVTDVLLQAPQEIWNWIEALPWHQSQELVSKLEKTVTFKLSIRATQDFYAQVLKWTPKVNVVAPPAVRNAIKKLYIEGLKNY
jgi:predicted DNA-binding transcriptional regulator YafY